MYKLNSILFISSHPSDISNYTNILTELSISNEVYVVDSIDEGMNYLEHYGKKNNASCPELIFLDFDNLLQQGIEFLESFSARYIENKERVRLIFLTSSSEMKEANTLKVLGDFEFLDRPFTQENFFNCLVSVPSFE